MNKRGEISLSSNEVTGLVLTFFFIFIVLLIGGKVLLNKGCPAGFDLISSNEFSPSIVKICGEYDKSGETLCCSRKSDPLQICRYDKGEKEFYLPCEKLTEFNFLKVCSDNTKCGASTDECSGGYCENGVCLVKEGRGKCVDKFEIDGKEIIVNDDSCEREFEGGSIGSKCEGARHCIFNAFTRDGKCSGGYFNVGVEDARKECRRLCDEARDAIDPLSSRFCTVKFPIITRDVGEPVEYDCYSSGSLIKTDCAVQCEPVSLIPVA
ncbi:hypothetical protein J4443_03495 [Candidatus Woesearchaeota archaeon]|nr:hypothetical protein [Candidatus Woesearchaeota archaeon]